jgi:deazaflavin-dependent oxidoreductase (nitroreductase family)
MPYPRWLAKINKRVFNPRQIRKGAYPVVTHVGRTSGRSYQTPLDAYPTETGYVLVARYGPKSDWVRNIVATGAATLRIDGEEHELGSPRLVSQAEALDVLVADEPPADFTKAENFVLMDNQTGLRPMTHRSHSEKTRSAQRSIATGNAATEDSLWHGRKETRNGFG